VKIIGYEYDIGYDFADLGNGKILKVTYMISEPDR